jgi:hypothetical protein
MPGPLSYFGPRPSTPYEDYAKKLLIDEAAPVKATSLEMVYETAISRPIAI